MAIYTSTYTSQQIDAAIAKALAGEGVKLLSSAEISSMTGSTHLVSSINIPSVAYINGTQFTDVPRPNEGTYVIVTLECSDTLNLQVAFGLTDYLSGQWYRTVNKSTGAINVNWTSKSWESFSGINSDSVANTICGKNFNNLPANKMYHLNLPSGHTVSNTPTGAGVALAGCVMTFSKAASVNTGAVQDVIVYNSTNNEIIHEFIRMKWTGSTWSAWKQVF